MSNIFVAETNIGKKRELNEDYMITYSPRDGCAVYVVLDGIGGSNSGEVASKLAGEKVIEYIKENFENGKRNIDTVAMAVKYANKCVYEMNKKDKIYKDMGTTIVLLYVEQNEAYYISVGDSRIYEIYNGHMVQLSEDDTYVNALVRDHIITKEEAKVHPDKHVLLKALGVTKSIIIEPHKIDESAYTKQFLLCTDGVTIALTDDEIYNIIEKSDTKSICKNIVEEANRKGGTDNITVVYVKE